MPDAVEVAATQLRSKASLKVVLGLLEGAGVKAAPVKGILTAGLLYDDVGERPLSDVDLRVAPADLPVVHGLAKAQGFPVSRASRLYGSVIFHVDGIAFDVEASVGPPFLCGMAIAELLARASRRREPLGFDHWQADLHDHALLMSVNVFKDHIVDAAPWAVRDLERVAALPTFTPSALVARATAAGNATLLWILAGWLAEVRGMARWGDVQRLLPRPARRRYARRVTQLAAGKSRPLPLEASFLARSAPDGSFARLAALATMGAWALTRGRL